MSAKYENYFKVVSPFIVLVFFMSLVPENSYAYPTFIVFVRDKSAHNNKQQLQQTHSIGHHAAKRAFDRLDTSMFDFDAMKNVKRFDAPHQGWWSHPYADDDVSENDWYYSVWPSAGEPAATEKRAFDRLDGNGFFGLHKRAFDRLDTSAFFFNHNKKREATPSASIVNTLADGSVLDALTIINISSYSLKNLVPQGNEYNGKLFLPEGLISY